LMSNNMFDTNKNNFEMEWKLILHTIHPTGKELVYKRRLWYEKPSNKYNVYHLLIKWKKLCVIMMTCCWIWTKQCWTCIMKHLSIVTKNFFSFSIGVRLMQWLLVDCCVVLCCALRIAQETCCLLGVYCCVT
jgi:hypothetical protein